MLNDLVIPLNYCISILLDIYLLLAMIETFISKEPHCPSLIGSDILSMNRFSSIYQRERMRLK